MGPTLLASKEKYAPYFGPKRNTPITAIIYKTVSTIAVPNLYFGAISAPTSTKTIAIINGKIAYSMSL